MRLKVLVVAGAMSAASLAAHADTIFSNIVSSTFVQGYGEVAEAAAFTPAQTEVLTGATALLFAVTADSVNFSIYSGPGTAPGALLQNLGSVILAANDNGLFTRSAPGSLTLLAGQQYWLVLSDASAFQTAWGSGGSSAQPFAYKNSIIDNFRPYGTNSVQFSIAGTPLATAATPEPSSILLLSTGMLGIAGVLKRRFPSWQG